MNIIQKDDGRYKDKLVVTSGEGGAPVGVGGEIKTWGMRIIKCTLQINVKYN